MKKVLLILEAAIVLFLGSCSKTDKNESILPVNPESVAVTDAEVTADAESTTEVDSKDAAVSETELSDVETIPEAARIPLCHTASVTIHTWILVFLRRKLIPSPVQFMKMELKFIP